MTHGCLTARCLTTRETDEWDGVLSRCEGADVHFSAAYHEACEADGRGEALLLVVEGRAALLAHPVLLRRVERVGGVDVPEDWSDAESAYGYTGPLTGGAADAGFLGEAWRAVGAELRARGVVAEFVRLHPYLANERLLPAGYRVLDVRRSVVLPVAACGDDEIWEVYPSAQRAMLRRAGRAGLTCREADAAGAELDAFIELYAEAMRRVAALPEYEFSRAYFETLGASLDGAARLLFAEDASGVAATGLFLAGPRIVHYHLGAAHVRRVPGATNLLLHEAARLARARGAESLHLGGGVTGDERDSLFRFKLSVSPETLPVRVACAVHDAAAYLRLCESWLAQAQVDERPAFHLLYRLPVPG